MHMPSPEPFFASACSIEIEHPEGLRLGGFATREGAHRGVHDAPRARLLMLQQGETRVVWVFCDLLGLSAKTDAGLRILLGEATRVPAEHVLVSCSHTHSAAASLPMRGQTSKVDSGWLLRTCARIGRAAEALPERLQEARIGWSSSPSSGLAYNRESRDVAIDETLTVLKIESTLGEPIASVIHYAMHPVALGPYNLWVSGEYCGMACAEIESTVGGICGFVQGACGDVDPLLMLLSGGGASFEDVAKLGHAVAEAAIDQIRSAPTDVPDGLSMATDEVLIPLDLAPPESALQRLREELDQLRHPEQRRWAEGEREWLDALAAQPSVPRNLHARFSALRIGALSIVAMPFEPYSETGREIRDRFGCPVIVAAYSNGLWGYLPTRSAIERGGYGAGRSHRFFPGLLTPPTASAASVAVDAAIGLLARVQPIHAG